MANAEHLAKLKEGVEVWNNWRDLNPGIRIDLSGTYLFRTNLSKVNLNRANLSKANLGEATLKNATLKNANLTEADLREANLSDANLNRSNHHMARLHHANLLRANLCRANLSRADFDSADLSDANLSRANLSRASLRAAKLIDTDLSGADLTEATLFEADLSGATLNETNLSWAHLCEANLSGAVISETIFGATTLTGTLGLETCAHLGPSTIDLRTLSTLNRSGPLPLNFLRGCGLSEEFITYLPSLLNQAIEFYSCFISYSTADQEFADRLHADLQNKGVRCWFAPHNMKSGKKIHEQIGEAIRLYDRLLLILSEHSMKSEWVKTEIAHARQKEVDRRRQVLFPVGLAPFSTVREWKCFDADTGKDSAREIREYFIPDFSNWKDHNSYKKACDRLLSDLKA